ncbi:MAG: hypothetical protein H6581_14760 [Bacteroidia bacterium]|nr:hypothetical protein [Bacteroidia bacterium]
MKEIPFWAVLVLSSLLVGGCTDSNSLNSNAKSTNRNGVVIEHSEALQMNPNDEWSFYLFEAPCLGCPDLKLKPDFPFPLPEMFNSGDLILKESISFSNRNFTLIANPIGAPDIYLNNDTLHLFQEKNENWRKPESIYINWGKDSLLLSYLVPYDIQTGRPYKAYHLISTEGINVVHAFYVDSEDYDKVKPIEEWLDQSLKIIYPTRQMAKRCTFQYQGKTAVAISKWPDR